MSDEDALSQEVQLVPVEIAFQRGFFDSVVEDPEVFEAVCNRSMPLLAQATPAPPARSASA